MDTIQNEGILTGDVVLFGASMSAFSWLQDYGGNVTIISVLDNDPEKWGTYFAKFVVENPKHWLCPAKQTFSLLIASIYYEEILEKMDTSILGSAKRVYYYDAIHDLHQDLTEEIQKDMDELSHSRFGVNGKNIYKELWDALSDHDSDRNRERYLLQAHDRVGRVIRRQMLLKLVEYDKEKYCREVRRIRKRIHPGNSARRSIHVMISYPLYYPQIFIEFINSQFDKQKHVFYLVNGKNNLNALEARLFADAHDNVFTLDGGEVDGLDNLFHSGDVCYLHSMHTYPQLPQWMIKRKPVIPVRWIPWGAEIFEMIDRNPYLQETEKLLIDLKIFRRQSADAGSLRCLRWRILLLRLDCLLLGCHTLESIIRREYPELPECLPFSYPDCKAVREFSSDLGDRFDDSLKVLIGNSGSPMNNHLEVFTCLSHNIPSHAEIYCPLSYGNEVYIRKICEIGNRIFADRFHPVLETMPREQYEEFLSTIDVGIFNFPTKSGANGHIKQLLSMGKKVFLNEEGPHYGKYRDFSIHIFSIQRDLKWEILQSPLSRIEKEMNHRLINQSNSVEALREQYMNIFC